MNNPQDMNLVTEVKKRYGNVIDLDKNPKAIIEIIHNFRHLIDEVSRLDPGQGGGGPNKIADEVGTAAILNLLLDLKREVQALQAKIK
jgi:hypothetical protein